jgi:hypothetical protein
MKLATDYEATQTLDSLIRLVQEPSCGSQPLEPSNSNLRKPYTFNRKSVPSGFDCADRDRSYAVRLQPSLTDNSHRGVSEPRGAKRSITPARPHSDRL